MLREEPQKTRGNLLPILVPRKKKHARVCIRTQAAMLQPNVIKSWAPKNKVPLITYMLPCATGACKGHTRLPTSPALLNWQGMHTNTKSKQLCGSSWNSMPRYVKG